MQITEMWFVSNIYLKPEYEKQRNNVLIDTIKPIVEELESKGLIQSFHILFEPFILFRVRLNECTDMSQVKLVIYNRLKAVDNLCSITYDESYHGEGNPEHEWSFGLEGWSYMQKFLEYGSRIVLLTMEVEMKRKPKQQGRIDSQFNVGKLVHCLLHQYGLSTVDEAYFHMERCFERVLRANGFFNIRKELIPQLKKGIENEIERVNGQIVKLKEELEMERRLSGG